MREVESQFTISVLVYFLLEANSGTRFSLFEVVLWKCWYKSREGRKEKKKEANKEISLENQYQLYTIVGNCSLIPLQSSGRQRRTHASEAPQPRVKGADVHLPTAIRRWLKVTPGS